MRNEPEKYPETFLPLKSLGASIPPYMPTHVFNNAYINSFHHSLAHCRLRTNEPCIEFKTHALWGTVIDGWLRREDALKLYEMAYFADGDVLELGCYKGLSTSLLARAIRDAGSSNVVYTADLSQACVDATMAILKKQGIATHVQASCADAVEFTRRLANNGKKFSFIFVDHSHAYQLVHEVCKLLADVTAPGGFCAFHDFNDGRNADRDNSDYGVYQAVLDGLDPKSFEFFGIFGCIGLYRRN